jgi:hypothetical protein
VAAERAAFKGKARELKARLAATHAGAKHDVATMQEVASRTASLIVSRAVSPTVALTVSPTVSPSLCLSLCLPRCVSPLCLSLFPLTVSPTVSPSLCLSHCVSHCVSLSVSHHCVSPLCLSLFPLTVSPSLCLPHCSSSLCLSHRVPHCACQELGVRVRECEAQRLHAEGLDRSLARVESERAARERTIAELQTQTQQVRSKCGVH